MLYFFFFESIINNDFQPRKATDILSEEGRYKIKQIMKYK